MLWLTYRHIRSRSYCCRRRNFHRVYITVSRNNLCNRFLVAGLGTCCTPCSSDIVTCRHCYRSNHHLYYCSWSLYFLMTGECDVVSRFIKEAWRIGMTYHPSCNRSCCFCRHNGRRQGISWRRVRLQWGGNQHRVETGNQLRWQSLQRGYMLWYVL